MSVFRELNSIVHMHSSSFSLALPSLCVCRYLVSLFHAHGAQSKFTIEQRNQHTSRFWISNASSWTPQFQHRLSNKVTQVKWLFYSLVAIVSIVIKCIPFEFHFNCCLPILTFYIDLNWVSLHLPYQLLSIVLQMRMPLFPIAPHSIPLELYETKNTFFHR